MISNGSKAFFILISLFLFISIAYTYYDSIILKRFDIFTSEEEIPSYKDLLNDLLKLKNS
jgi:hypothetical protein